MVGCRWEYGLLPSFRGGGRFGFLYELFGFKSTANFFGFWFVEKLQDF